MAMPELHRARCCSDSALSDGPVRDGICRGTVLSLPAAASGSSLRAAPERCGYATVQGVRSVYVQHMRFRVAWGCARLSCVRVRSENESESSPQDVDDRSLRDSWL